MVMNKQVGNMYPFVTHTWNPIKGKCPHDCSYCYMKRFPQVELRLDEKALQDDLGEGNYIFVGSSTDMFYYKILGEWKRKVLSRCSEFPNNTYLFQSKNVSSMAATVWVNMKRGNNSFENIVLGTTIESNREYNVSKAPSVEWRQFMLKQEKPFRKMVSIEPIMDFDLDILAVWMKEIKPEFVSIGADSKGHNLLEPSWEKINLLIEELKKFTEVKVKPNLKRLQKEAT